MPIEDTKQAADDDVPFTFTYLLLALLSVLCVREICHVIRRRRVFSKKMAVIVASNRMDAYKAEEYCTVCCSSATHRCSYCGAPAYCSKKCQRDHWKQGHSEECLLMIEVVANEAEGQEKDESNKTRVFLGLRNDQDYLVCAHWDSPPKAGLWLWPEFNIFGFEEDHRIRYMMEECQPFGSDAGESANDASEIEYTASVSENSSSFEQETRETVWSSDIPRFITLKCNEKRVSKGFCSKCEADFHCSRDCQRYHWINSDQEIALENGCCNRCVAIISCSEHCLRYEWMNAHKQERQRPDDVGQSTKASEFEHSISHAQTLDASATDYGERPRRVTRRITAAEHADHAAVRHRYSTALERSSSSCSADSSCASCSVGASGSYSVSTLHDLD